MKASSAYPDLKHAVKCEERSNQRSRRASVSSTPSKNKHKQPISARNMPPGALDVPKIIFDSTKKLAFRVSVWKSNLVVIGSDEILL